MAKAKMTIKMEDDVSPVLKKLNMNLQQINKLLQENKKLLAEVLKGAIEIV